MKYFPYILRTCFYLKRGGGGNKQDYMQRNKNTILKKFKKKVKKDYKQSKNHLFVHFEGISLWIQCFDLYLNSGFWTFSAVIARDLFSTITSHSPQTTQYPIKRKSIRNHWRSDGISIPSMIWGDYWSNHVKLIKIYGKKEGYTAMFGKVHIHN